VRRMCSRTSASTWSGSTIRRSCNAWSRAFQRTVQVIVFDWTATESDRTVSVWITARPTDARPLARGLRIILTTP